MRFSKFDVFLALVVVMVLAIIAFTVASLPFGEEVFGATGAVAVNHYSPPTDSLIAGKIPASNPASYTITVAVDGRWATMEFDTKSGEVFHVGQTVRVNYKHAWLTRRIHLTSVTPIR